MEQGRQKSLKKRLSFSALSYQKQKIIVSVLFLALPMILLLTFTYIPAVKMLQYSFEKWDGLKPPVFVGLENYKTILSDPDTYLHPLVVSLYYFIGSFIQIGLALVIASVLSFKVFAKNAFKGIYFFPSLINSVAIAFVFLFFFRPEGTLDSVLGLVGIHNDDVLWLGNVKLINVSLTFASVWRYIGYTIVFFTAAIQSISTDLFEASSIDGANEFQQFLYIIIPNIKVILGLQLFLSISGALLCFEMPYIMTGGGNGSTTFVIQAVQTAFNQHIIGLASALAYVLILIIAVLTTIEKLIERKVKRGEAK